MTEQVEGREQEIGAYYGELGLTSEGDALLYMYDMNPGLQWVIAVEYEDKFNTLPEPMKSAVDDLIQKDAVNKYLKNPTKAEAERDGKLVLLETPFTVFVRKKGKRVEWQTMRAGGAGEQAEQAASGLAAGTYVWEPLTDEQTELAKQLAKDVVEIQWILAHETLDSLAEDTGADEIKMDMYATMAEHVYRSASYDFAKLWPTVRGSYVAPVSDGLDAVDVWLGAIKETPADDFLETLAEYHPLIIDADFAKVVLKSLGETGIKPDAEGRVLQAKKVFLFIELTSRHGLSKGMAKTMVDQAYDQIPF